VQWFAPEQPVSQLHWVSRVPAVRSTLFVGRHSHKTIKGCGEPRSPLLISTYLVQVYPSGCEMKMFRQSGRLCRWRRRQRESLFPVSKHVDHVQSCLIMYIPSEMAEREGERQRERERETREIYMWLLHTMKRWNMVYLLFAFARHSSSALELSLFDSSLSIHKCSVVSTVGTCMLPPPSLHKSVSCCHERGGCLEVIPNKSSQCVEK